MAAERNHRESFKRPLTASVALHAILLLIVLVVAPEAHQRGEPWGGPGGGAISVSVVRSLPGIPLPRPEVVTPSRRATESSGLHRREPTREVRREPERGREAPRAATELPRFGQEPQRATRPTRPAREEPATEPLPGAIPYGEGGPVALPYTSFQVGGAEGGMAFGEGGAFGSRYPWYVESVRRRISSNWLISTIDPYVQFAPRVVLTFEILRDGSVVNTQMLRSSGIPSVDRSALRAIRDSSPLDRLPSDYRGDKVLVEFWFDFRR
jgi:protein TonB